jgi:hypothetical protein
VAITPPALIPVSTPDVPLMVAIAALLLLHVPPGVTSLSVVVAPLHMDVIPVMLPGNGFTVTLCVIRHPAAVV